jgi:hypothetical protein
MKFIIVIILFCMSSTILANSKNSEIIFQENDSSIVQVLSKIISQKNFNNKSEIEIEITLPGCLDRMAGYSYSFKEINGKGILFFSALSISNKASLTTRCFVANQKFVKVLVPFDGDIELKQLNFFTTHE